MTATVLTDFGLESRATPKDRVAVAGLWVIIFSMIFLQRFGFAGVPLTFAVSYLVLIVLLLRGSLVIDRMFLALFLIAMALCAASFFFWRSEASVGSYLYLIAIAAMYMLRFRDRTTSFAAARRIYLDLMVVAALAGISQFFAQFALGTEVIFPLESLPEEFLLPTYNTIIPLNYGASIVKSSGLFFLEPSFFSQFLAIALILELLGRQRALRCGIYAVALVSSYSGTGLLLLALFLPFVIARRVSAPLMIAGMALVVGVVLSMSVLELDTIFGRIGEFSSPESSGFARFVSPFYLIRDFLMPSPLNLLFGMGPGTIEVALDRASYNAYLAHDPTWIKLIFEYGLIGGLATLGYVMSAMYVGAENKLFRTALLFTWLFLGGYLLSGLMNMLLITLGALHSRPSVERQDRPLVQPPPPPRRRHYDRAA